MIRLIWPLDRDAQVVGLLLGKPGEVGVQSTQMQPGHLVVQFFREGIHLRVQVSGDQINQGQTLVGKAVAHHEAGMASGAPEVHQAAFGQDDD